MLVISDCCQCCILECDIKEAVALYDFHARTKRELSFNKGDTLTLYEQVSADWWEGVTSDDRDGLIPDKYVRIRHRLVAPPTTFISLKAQTRISSDARCDLEKKFYSE